MPRILCVDDEPFNLELLEAMLVSRGYDVALATNGQEAMEKIRSERIDICLLDVMMPGMDGFEVCRRIKVDEEHDNIPVIMITANADRKNRIQGIEAGAEDFISKPFDQAEVVARIKMLLKAKEQNDRLNSAYNNIIKLSALSEHLITDFNPARFSFLEMVDSIVHQIIRRRFDDIDSPEIVVIGMVDQGGICHWLRYDSTGKDIQRSDISMILGHKCMIPGHKCAFSDSTNPGVAFYNEAETELATSAIDCELKKQLIPFKNMVKYANASFCLIALNYGREVTTHDATVLSSVAMQGLFLKSMSMQARDTESAFEYTVFALARASEANDEDTGNHILRVGDYCALLARHLKMSNEFEQIFRIQATLHDVGKIHVSPAILKKTGNLTEDEWREMRMHTVHGEKIIGGHLRMSTAARIAVSHHERYDGSGYPYGLSGKQIPIEGRLLNLADQYDALRNARCYKPAFDHDTTFRIITKGDGRTLPQHFDPEALAAFKEIHGRFAEIFETMR